MPPAPSRQLNEDWRTEALRAARVGSSRGCAAMIARDGFLPHSFAHRGRRLVYSRGILVLAMLADGLLIAFSGVTDRLIPLFAIGAFLAFTMSPAGMVAHWCKAGGPQARLSMAINAAGAVSTAVTLVVVLVSKFIDGVIKAFLLFSGFRRVVIINVAWYLAD